MNEATAATAAFSMAMHHKNTRPDITYLAYKRRNTHTRAGKVGKNNLGIHHNAVSKEVNCTDDFLVSSGAQKF